MEEENKLAPEAIPGTVPEEVINVINAEVVSLNVLDICHATVP